MSRRRATPQQVAIIREAYDKAERPSDPRNKGVARVSKGIATRLAASLGLSITIVSEIGRRKSYLSPTKNNPTQSA